MPLPGDTNNFDPLSMGVAGVTPINVALGQLSYAITLLQAIASNGTVSIEVTAGESLAARDVAYLNPADNELYAIDANAAPVLAGTVRGFVEEPVSAAATATLLIAGIMDGFTGLTAWLPVYADTSGAGTITQTQPAPVLDSGQMAVVPMGVAISATQVAIMPPFMDCRIRYQKRFSPALDETTTLEHGKNVDGFGRKFGAYVTQPPVLTEYGSSNQDVNVQIRGQSGAGSSTSFVTSATATAVGDVAGAETLTAQSFQLAAAGQLSQFTFTLVANSGSPVGDLHWEIRTDSGGSGPTDGGTTILASGDIANGSVTPSAINTVNISNGPFLAATTTYWIVLYADAQATNVWWSWARATGGGYASGEVRQSTNGGASWGASIGDAGFAVTAAALSAKDKLAQGFQVSAASTVNKVRLWLKKVGAPTGNLTAKIQTDTAGSPSGTPVTNGTSVTVAASSLSTSYGYIDFTFSTPPNLSASTQYHLVLETADSASDTNYVEWGADASSPGYSSGVMKSEVAAAWGAESKDAVFQVSANGMVYINPVTVDWWSSTHADMVAQAGDSSGADVDTKTTFKCKLSAGFEDITVEATL